MAVIVSWACLAQRGIPLITMIALDGQYTGLPAGSSLTSRRQVVPGAGLVIRSCMMLCL